MTAPFINSVETFARRPDAPYAITVALSMFGLIGIAWLIVATIIVTAVGP